MKDLEEETQETTSPDWVSDLAMRFKSGVAHEFIVYGNVTDLVPNPDAEEEPDRKFIPFRQFLEKSFDARQMVIFYNIASGIRFTDPAMETQFRKITGLDKESDDGSDNPVSSAKAALAKKRSIPKEPEACLPLIEQALTGLKGVAVIISYAHMLAPAATGGISLSPNDRTATVRLGSWAHNEEIKNNGNIVILLTDQLASVTTQLRENGSGIHTIFVPKPSFAERQNFLRSITGGEEYRRILKKLRELQSKTSRSAKKLSLIEAEIQECKKELEAFPDIFLVPEGFDLNVFSIATQGMSYRQIFEIFLRSREEKKDLDLNYVKEKKKEILNAEYGDIMEVCEPRRGLEDIGGLEHIKIYLKSVLEAIEIGESRLVPMGITLMGPPGTGKTAIVESLAKEAGFNFVKIKNVRSMWVGESEARMQKLIEAMRSLAPVVVNNDESDLAEAGRDSPKGDSGVSERLMKAWMELLSDPKIRGQIIIFSCTNRPDRIDPALKRSGRSDDRILVPMPSKEERKAIFRVMFTRHNIPTEIAEFSEFAELTAGLSGADIEKISLNSFGFASTQGKKSVDGNALQEAIEDFIPSASQAEIDMMTLMAIMESSSRRLLPPHIKEIVLAIQDRGLVENLEGIMAQIQTRNIVEVN